MRTAACTVRGRVVHEQRSTNTNAFTSRTPLRTRTGFTEHEHEHEQGHDLLREHEREHEQTQKAYANTNTNANTYTNTNTNANTSMTCSAWGLLKLACGTGSRQHRPTHYNILVYL